MSECPIHLRRSILPGKGAIGYTHVPDNGWIFFDS